MPHMETIREERNGVAVFAASGAIVLSTAVVDWWTKAGVPAVHFALEFLALAGCGLFVREWLRNRRRGMEAKERLRVLVETSPAAIMTMDEHGFIELANRAAAELVTPRDGRLVGRPIAAFFPELHHALNWVESPQFRTSLRCHGHRDSGAPFVAEVCCSTYQEGASIKLAAIVAAVTEETGSAGPPSRGQGERAALSGRETEVLGFLVEGLANKEIAARMDISESMVKYTVQQLFAKTEVRTRSELVRVALESYADLLRAPSPIIAAALTPASDLPDQEADATEPLRSRLAVVQPGAGSRPAAVHQAACRTQRPAARQPVSRQARHRGTLHTMGAKRAAGAGGLTSL
jgi:PAS domain S-box-containing protein